MIIAVQGTKSFSDYNVFMRAMSVALHELKDGKTIEVWTAGPHKVNSHTAAFCNVSENYLKTKGIKIFFRSLPEDHIIDNINDVDYVIFLSTKREKRVSKLVGAAELAGTEVGIFRY